MRSALETTMRLLPGSLSIRNPARTFEAALSRTRGHGAMVAFVDRRRRGARSGRAPLEVLLALAEDMGAERAANQLRSAPPPGGWLAELRQDRLDVRPMEAA